ncbi:MAG: right-handed parallel beta-helix repeat-containing protein [Terrimicrobiaceae bacterium]|nr:right-handed parallel beta-helix repeat-containing protein [Terrimicrobiaceae bacterium]
MATYYVATTGNNGNAGTISSPRRDIASGQTLLSSADTLLIRGGTYHEAVVAISGSVPNGADDANHTVIAGYPGETVTIDGATADQPLTVHSCAYVTIDNLTIVGGQDGGAGTAEGALGVGQRLGLGVHHLLLSNLIVHHTGGIFIAADVGDNHHLTLRGLTVYHTGYPWPGGFTPHGHSIYVEHCDDSIIEDCEVYDTDSHGIHVFSQSGLGTNRLTVRRCKLHDNGSFGLLFSSGSNNVAYNNLVYGNGIASWAGGGAGGMRTYDGAIDCAFYNNSVYNNLGIGIWVQNGDGIFVKNNIGYLNSSNFVNAGSNSVIDPNLWGDPAFTNGPGADFTLQSSSAARNAGVDLSGIFPGDYLQQVRSTPWDIGAYRYGVVVPPASTARSQVFIF